MNKIDDFDSNFGKAIETLKQLILSPIPEVRTPFSIFWQEHMNVKETHTKKNILQLIGSVGLELVTEHL